MKWETVGHISYNEVRDYKPFCHICEKQKAKFIWLRFTLNGKEYIGAICKGCAVRFTQVNDGLTKEKKAK